LRAGKSTENGGLVIRAQASVSESRTPREHIGTVGVNRMILRMLIRSAVLLLVALWFGMDFPALAVGGPPFARPAPVLSPVSTASGLGWVFPRYLILYRAAGGPSFNLVPERLAADPSAAQQARPSSMDQVTLGAFDPVNNALRINATLTPGGSHTPANADQVFTSIFDPVNNAVRVNCIAGCGSSLTLAGDLGGSLAAQRVIGLEGRPLSAAAPAANQVLTWNGSAWAPASAAAAGVQIAQDLGGSAAAPRVVGLQGSPLSSVSPSSSNEFLGWNGTQWTPVQPSFSNLSGVASQSQLPAYSGIGACPANQFASTLNQGVAPTCAQPSFSSLSGTVASGQLPAATGVAQGALVLAKDLGGTAASPQVVGLRGSPVASTAPSNNQVLTWTGTAWTPQTPASGGAQIAQDLGGTLSAPKVVGLQGYAVSATGPNSSNQFLGWNPGTSAWTPTQPSFANLSGTVNDAQLANPYSGVGVCPANQFVVTLVRNAPPLCAVAVTASPGYPNQFATGISASGAMTYAQPSFSNLGGSIAASQTPLSMEGDLLYSHTGALARLGVGLSGTCLTSNGTDPTWGPCAGAGAIFSSPSSQQTITPISDLTPLVLTAKSGGQISDIFDVCDVPSCATKYLGVGTGGITSSFSQWTAGQVGQATPGSFAALSGSGTTVSTGYFSVQLNDHTVLGNFTADPTQPGLHIPCFTSGTPSGPCPAGTQLVLNPMLGSGDLMVGSAGGTPVRLAANSTGTSCLTETSAGVASWGPCGGGSAAAWSSLTAPAANLSLSMGSNKTALTYGNATGAKANLFNITDTTNNTGTGYLVTDEVQSGSTTLPLLVGSEATTGSFSAPAAPGAGYAGVDLFQLGAATSSANYNSPLLRLCGQYFSTSTTADCWTLQESLGTGSSPTSALALVHSGSTGALSVSFPSAGTSLKNVSNVASAAGNLQLQAGAAAGYVAFQGSTGLNKTLADPNGTVLANGAGYAVRNAGNSQYYTIQLKATSAVSAGNLVCVDSANADQIISCATGTSSGIVGFAPVAIAAAATGDIVLQGVVTNAVLDGTCAIGNWVIPSGTTSGHVSCTSTFTGGKIAGIAMSKTGLHVLANRE
jgi:hypothetical protein